MRIADNNPPFVHQLDLDVTTTKTPESVGAKSSQVPSQPVSHRKIALIAAVVASGALIALGVSLFNAEPLVAGNLNNSSLPESSNTTEDLDGYKLLRAAGGTTFGLNQKVHSTVLSNHWETVS